METINQIYSKHYNEVLTYVKFKINGKHEIAEEITDDVFIKVHEHLSHYDCNKSALKTWLFNIANNKIIDYYRANGKNPEINVGEFVDVETGKEVFSFVENSTPETFNNDNELRKTIRKSFRTLKSDYKRIAVLYFLRDKQYSEIAEICQVPMGTVKGYMYRIREKLQSELKREYANI
jgi:RNA polymerase sigma-70 factor (ECF subfamily)